ncbi:AAA family ATPase [Candidatus Peregrinibacteria bacterium]|jgi:dCMP deaminase|nr:AAA family ATPase [Candidatus Peregrinibacteria bacterium]MBT4055647.1 AAA family ATPase [Candidatus Peregrinibacteria bacterium]
MYVALTGYMGTGKGAIAKKLETLGYRYISLSDMIREEADKRGVEHSRGNLQDIGNELRNTHGPGVFGLRVREKIEGEEGALFGTGKWIIDGVRNPSEATEIKRIPNSKLLAVTASLPTITERIRSRKRPGEENITKEEVFERLKKESGVGEDETGQQVQKCLDVSEFLIINEGSLEELDKKLDHFVKSTTGAERPTFDEVFMEVSYTWAKRATCCRRKVGAVIAKDKQQLTAGYNGAPRGVPHCAEVGCIREKLNVPSGKNAELCRGTHAEQNAITQAAKFGISIDGATLYCNTFPCVICTKMILNSGIVKVIYDCDYDDPLSKEILAQQTHVEMIRYEGKKFRV